jgi:hypothetical protein
MVIESYTVDVPSAYGFTVDAPSPPPSPVGPGATSVDISVSSYGTGGYVSTNWNKALGTSSGALSRSDCIAVTSMGSTQVTISTGTRLCFRAPGEVAGLLVTAISQNDVRFQVTVWRE